MHLKPARAEVKSPPASSNGVPIEIGTVAFPFVTGPEGSFSFGPGLESGMSWTQRVPLHGDGISNVTLPRTSSPALNTACSSETVTDVCDRTSVERAAMMKGTAQLTGMRNMAQLQREIEACHPSYSVCESDNASPCVAWRVPNFAEKLLKRSRILTTFSTSNSY